MQPEDKQFEVQEGNCDIVIFPSSFCQLSIIFFSNSFYSFYSRLLCLVADS